jgi:hypothetical protein
LYRYKKENVRILHGMVYKKTWSFIVDRRHGTSISGLAGLMGPSRLPLICVDISSCIQVSFQLNFRYDASLRMSGGIVPYIGSSCYFRTRQCSHLSRVVQLHSAVTAIPVFKAKIAPDLQPLASSHQRQQLARFLYKASSAKLMHVRYSRNIAKPGYRCFMIVS